MAHNPTEVALNRIEEYLRPTKGKVASLLSLGCGMFPPQPIGNLDMGTANVFNILGRVNNLITVLTTAVSCPRGRGLVIFNVFNAFGGGRGERGGGRGVGREEEWGIIPQTIAPMIEVFVICKPPDLYTTLCTFAVWAKHL